MSDLTVHQRLGELQCGALFEYRRSQFLKLHSTIYGDACINAGTGVLTFFHPTTEVQQVGTGHLEIHNDDQG